MTAKGESRSRKARRELAGWGIDQRHTITRSAVFRRRNPGVRITASAAVLLTALVFAPTANDVTDALGIDTKTWTSQADFDAGTYADTLGVTDVHGDGVQLDVEGEGLPRPDIEWWEGDWGQRRCIDVENPGGSALTEFPIEVRVDTAVSIAGGRMNADGNDIRFIAADGVTELPYWIGAGLNTDYTTLWVQADVLPPGGTTICMYYDNPAAPAMSDHVAPFTYSTPQPLYVAVEEGGGNFGFASYLDGNNVSVGTIGAPGTATTRAEGAIWTQAVGEAGVVWANGPVSSRGHEGGTDTLVPLAWASTEVLVPSNRGTQTYAIYSPYGAANVTITQGVTTGAPFVVPAGGQLAVTDDAGAGQAAIINSDLPILVFHETTQTWDTFVAYPPTADVLYGVVSTGRWATATVAGTIVQRESGGVTDAADAVPVGNFDSEGGGGRKGAGPAVALTLSQPMAVISQADADGNESTVLLPQMELNSIYILPDLPRDAFEYIATACSDQGGTIAFGGTTARVPARAVPAFQDSGARREWVRVT